MKLAALSLLALALPACTISVAGTREIDDLRTRVGVLEQNDREIAAWSLQMERRLPQSAPLVAPTPPVQEPPK